MHYFFKLAALEEALILLVELVDHANLRKDGSAPKSETSSRQTLVQGLKFPKQLRQRVGLAMTAFAMHQRLRVSVP